MRWEGWSHRQIHERVSAGPGAAVTERLEARLASVSRALYENSDQVNATLQRVDGGDWDGGTATAAAAAMRVVRDFDDILGHHGKLNELAAFGQSDNAAWARANVPPYVDVRVLATPTGHPLDAFNATVDHHLALRAAKDAEERAREVMRQYQTMTATRIAALPPLSPAPRLVVGTGTDDPESALRPRTYNGEVVRRADQPGDGKPPPELRPSGGERLPAGPAGPAGTAGSPADSPLGAAPAPPGRDATPNATEQPRTTVSARSTPSGRPAAIPDMVRGQWESAPPARPGARPESVLQSPLPGPIGTTPQPPRGGFAALARPNTGSGGPLGVVPGGHGRPADDEEHHDRYAVAESAFFEAEDDDGMLHDPFRPGSHVAPPAIGDGDE